MNVLNTIELFSGSKSFSNVAHARGHNTFTVDIEKQYNPDLVCDILELQAHHLPKNIDILWASPPCTTFSVSSIGFYWDNGKPKNIKTWLGRCHVLKTIELIKEIKPKIWFIENPRGMLRKEEFMRNIHRKTVTYCKYGDTRQKPTDIWTNLEAWKPRPMRKSRALCHESSPRGCSGGTQNLVNAYERSRIPPALFNEILDFIEDNNIIKNNTPGFRFYDDFKQKTLNEVLLCKK